MSSVTHRVRLFVTPWTVARQGPLSMGFSRQEYGSGLPFPSPGDLPDPGIEPTSLASPALAGGFFTIVHFVKNADSDPSGWGLGFCISDMLLLMLVLLLFSRPHS